MDAVEDGVSCLWWVDWSLVGVEISSEDRLRGTLA